MTRSLAYTRYTRLIKSTGGDLRVPTARPIGILYEHPEWFQPLFAELERREMPHARILAHALRYEPAAQSLPYSLIVNRVSPSSYLRGHTHAVFAAADYLAHAERLGVPVVNGTRAYGFELSKARQLSLLASLGLPHPRSVVANTVVEIARAAEQLTYPLIVKPNIGGSGALMQRFDSQREVDTAAAAGQLETVLGLDYTAIVQEYHPPKDGAIVRVEALDDQFLYAIRIHNDPSQGFNLCPADICQTPQEAVPAVAGSSEFELCPVDAPAKKPLKIEATTPPSWIVDAVLLVFRSAGIDVGGVEYLESERDGQVYFYDVNALSNFVTDAPSLVGFNPFERFVDFLERRARG
jgi:hypothetical protein